MATSISSHPLFCTSSCGANPLPGTAPLTVQGDRALQMVDAINADLLEKTAQSVARRPAAPDRALFRKVIGAVDARLPVDALEYVDGTAAPAQVGHGPATRSSPCAGRFFPV